MPDFIPFSSATLLTFALAWSVIVVVPGPTVTIIVANSLRSGTKAGLMTVAGTQAAVSTMVILLALGLETIVSSYAVVLVWIKFIGAAYLVWLGLKLWRSSLQDTSLLDLDAGADRTAQSIKPWRYFWQGFGVLWSNPKAFVFFGAFIPQFIIAGPDTTLQVLILGFLAMVIGAILDGAYAILAGGAGSLLTRERIRWTERIAGAFLIGGGIWLALSRRL